MYMRIFSFLLTFLNLEVTMTTCQCVDCVDCCFLFKNSCVSQGTMGQDVCVAVHASSKVNLATSCGNMVTKSEKLLGSGSETGSHIMVRRADCHLHSNNCLFKMTSYFSAVFKS